MSKEIMAMCQELGECQFCKDDVEKIVEQKLEGEYLKAYEKGVLLGEFEVRKTILQMSKQGSSPAIKEFIELSKKRKEKESKNQW